MEDNLFYASDLTEQLDYQEPERQSPSTSLPQQKLSSLSAVTSFLISLY